jgi:hypothetical protein
MIFSYLEFRERVSVDAWYTIFTLSLTFQRICLRVSKSWKAYLTSVPHCWRTLDFFGSHARQQLRMPKRFVRNCLQWSRCQIEEANIDTYMYLPAILNLARVCKNLKTLRIGRRSRLPPDEILQITAVARNLEVLRLPDSSLEDSFVQTLVKHVPRLKNTVLRVGAWAAQLRLFPSPLANMSCLYIHATDPILDVVDLPYVGVSSTLLHWLT